jgi:hypothetical protein
MDQAGSAYELGRGVGRLAGCGCCVLVVVGLVVLIVWLVRRNSGRSSGQPTQTPQPPYPPQAQYPPQEAQWPGPQPPRNPEDPPQ